MSCLQCHVCFINTPTATSNGWTAGPTAGLVPVCHATYWDGGSLYAPSFFSDRSVRCRSTYTQIKTPQGGRAATANTQQSLPSWGGVLRWSYGGKGLSSEGKLHAGVFILWINFHQSTLPLTDGADIPQEIGSTDLQGCSMEFSWGWTDQKVYPSLSVPFSWGNMISGDDEEGN